MSEGKSRYLAFISYRHTDRDEAVAAALRRGLESYHVGRKSSLSGPRRVFRDTDELPTSSDLGRDIETALYESGWLIAICSEDYPLSRWCRSEILSFIAMGRKDRILPVLVSGSPETSVPEEIRGLPLAADLRGAAGPVKKTVNEQIPYLLGKMSGEDPERLLSNNRRNRMARAACAAAALAAVIAGFALYATRTADMISENNTKIVEATGEAEAARQEALERRNNALLNQALFLAESGWDELQAGNTEEAVRLALSGLPEDLHGEYPVSPDLMGLLRTAMSIREKSWACAWSVPLPFETVSTDRLSTRSDYLTLSGEKEMLALHPDTGETVQFDTGLQERITSVLQKGLEEGYPIVLGANSDGRGYAVFGGGGKPVISIDTLYGETLTYTLDGRPFIAERMIHGDNYSSILAWNNGGGEGGTPEAVILFQGKPEITVRLQLESEILSADYIQYTRVAVVDGEGKLGVYRISDGSCVYTVDGTWRSVRYGYWDGYGYLTAVSSEGTVCRIEEETGRQVWTVQLSSPAVRVDRVAGGGRLLVLCGDRVCLVSEDSGEVEETVLCEAGPLLAAWDDRVRGSRFLLFYSDHAECYEKKESQVEAPQGTMMLSTPEMPYGKPLAYTADGQYLYLTSRGSIAKWDTRSGELLWLNQSDWGEVYGSLNDLLFSADRRFIWRETYRSYDFEKVDTETGETLYRTDFGIPHRIQNPEESPDGRHAIVNSTYGKKIILFDTETGRKCWEKEIEARVYAASFSEDSARVWLLLTDYAGSGENYRKVLTLQQYDTETGILLEETELSGPEDPLKAAFDALPGGYEGSVSIYQEDGNCLFLGEKAKVSSQKIVSIADSAVMLDGNLLIRNSGIAENAWITRVSPDGKSVCIAGNGDSSPILVRPPEDDTLVRNARQRQEVREP